MCFIVIIYLVSNTMSCNRIYFYIKNIVENSKLNKYKFVKNKKLYNNSLVKNNHILISKRNFGISSFRFEDPNNNNNNNSNWGFIVIAGIISYFVTRKFN